MLLNVNGRELVSPDQVLADENSILVVATVPAQECTQHVLSECQLAALRRTRVSQYIASRHPITFPDNRALINTRGLVGTVELAQRINLHVSIVFPH